MPMLLGGYTRVSRVGDRQDTLVSPDLQQRRIQEYADARGLKVEMLPPELDVSGGKVDRPILGEAIDRVERRELGGLIVAQLDRLSRMQVADALLVIRRIEAAGGQVIAVAEQFDPGTPEGRWARTQFLSMAELQLDRYKLQFRAAKLRAVDAGIWPAPKVPLGYRKGTDRRLEPDPATAPLVVQAFEARATGASWNQVALILARGYTGAAKIVRNRVYLGEIHLGDLANVSAHPPLVDRALWEAAQLDHPRPARGVHPAALLTGIVKCANCGGAMGPNMARNHRNYRCIGTNRTAGGKRCDRQAIIGQAKIDPYIEAAVLAVLKGAKVTARVRTDQVDRLTERLRAAEAERDLYQQTVRLSDIGPDAFLAGAKTRQAQVDELAAELASARAALPVLPDSADLVALYRSWPVEKRRHLLRGALAGVVVEKGTGRVEDRVRLVAHGHQLPSFPVARGDDVVGEVRAVGTE
jgi:DNA invertase Pin-like site-specific DNA recombinase